eukprot:751601-Hanusia_phi.AAC.2
MKPPMCNNAYDLVPPVVQLTSIVSEISQLFMHSTCGSSLRPVPSFEGSALAKFQENIKFNTDSIMKPWLNTSIRLASEINHESHQLQDLQSRKHSWTLSELNPCQCTATELARFTMHVNNEIQGNQRIVGKPFDQL